MYVNLPALEATAPTVFMVWLQACNQGKCKVKSNNLAYINIDSHGYLQLCKKKNCIHFMAFTEAPSYCDNSTNLTPPCLR